nr:hypothetical protein [Tanacetum cinerariifolium]
MSSGLGPQLLTPGTVISGLLPQPPSATPNVPPTKNDWYTLFCPMFDEYFNPSPSVAQPVLVAVVQEPVVLTGTPSSTRIDQDTPSKREAVEASKRRRRRSLLDHIIQLLSKGSSEGSEVTGKQDGNVQTSLTLSSAKLEIQSMMDFPIHQEDPVVQRTPLIDTIFSMVTDKTASTLTPPTTQAHVQICLTS